MKKIGWLLALLTLLTMGGANPAELIRLTVINKSEMEVAVQLSAIPQICVNKAEVVQGEFYYLRVPKGTKETPSSKEFTIRKDTYSMRVFYLETYDPVYGFKCNPTLPNMLQANRNLRVVVLPCGQVPRNPRAVGEGSMWKYLPYPVPDLAEFFTDYWKSRLIY